MHRLKSEQRFQIVDLLLHRVFFLATWEILVSITIVWQNNASQFWKYALKRKVNFTIYIIGLVSKTFVPLLIIFCYNFILLHTKPSKKKTSKKCAYRSEYCCNSEKSWVEMIIYSRWQLIGIYSLTTGAILRKDLNLRAYKIQSCTKFMVKAAILLIKVIRN